jgi:hypothetical protein
MNSNASPPSAGEAGSAGRRPEGGGRRIAQQGRRGCCLGNALQHQSLSGQISGLTIEFARDFAARYVAYMTAAKVIEEIMHLPREEQSRVVEFAFELARKRQLSGKELSAMAQRMVDSDDPAEVERLKAEITRGFYGD